MIGLRWSEAESQGAERDVGETQPVLPAAQERVAVLGWAGQHCCSPTCEKGAPTCGSEAVMFQK